MLTDTHSHLYWDSFKEDFDEMLKRAIDAGVTTLINVGVDVEKSKVALRQIQETNWPKPLQVYSTIGIHPHESVRYLGQKSHDRIINVQRDIDQLEEIYRGNPEDVVAIGECGLDYLIDRNDIYPDQSLPEDEVKEMQRQLFQAQIDLAKKLNLPLIVHCRDNRSKNPENSEAWDEVLKMIGEHLTILHCYSGLPQTTNYILHTTNLIVSFAATITYQKNEYLREAAKLLPLEKTVLETDCPFLPPQSKRGQRNEPASVLEIAKLIAEIKGVSLEEISEKTTKNVYQLFNIDSSTPRLR